MRALQRQSTAELNRRTYDGRDVVWSYALRSALQPPEARIRDLLGEPLGAQSMLDLGVGGGRTAVHFLDRAGEYVGLDYAPRMIRACQRRFPGRADAFVVGDARAMSLFPDGRFDFVLYSYNGLDCMEHDDRTRALAEVHRVCKPGARFCFSSHSLLALARRGWPRPRWNLMRWFSSWKDALLLHGLNDVSILARLHERPHEIIRDLPRVRTYYVTPREQLRQLERAGFGDVRFFGLRRGDELPTVEAAEASADSWLYYLCSRT